MKPTWSTFFGGLKELFNQPGTTWRADFWVFVDSRSGKWQCLVLALTENWVILKILDN